MNYSSAGHLLLLLALNPILWFLAFSTRFQTRLYSLFPPIHFFICYCYFQVFLNFVAGKISFWVDPIQRLVFHHKELLARKHRPQFFEWLRIRNYPEAP